MEQVIYVSEHLKNTVRGQPVYLALKKILNDRLKIIKNNKNEWCRDYMPVKALDGTLVLFHYMPSYLLGSKTNEKTIPNQKLICNDLGIEFKDCSSIILDGGAIDIYKKKGMISDRVISENCSAWGYDKPIVIEKIRTALKLFELIVVPADPFDFTGHVDGMVRFINENTVLVNDNTGMDSKMKGNDVSPFDRKRYENWKRNFNETLSSAGLKMVKLPYAADQNLDDVSAKGVYMNFLLLKDMVILPTFSNQSNLNTEAKRILKKEFNRNVFSIEADMLSEWGGIINCVTWQNETSNF